MLLFAWKNNPQIVDKLCTNPLAIRSCYLSLGIRCDTLVNNLHCLIQVGPFIGPTRNLKSGREFRLNIYSNYFFLVYKTKQVYLRT